MQTIIITIIIIHDSFYIGYPALFFYHRMLNIDSIEIITEDKRRDRFDKILQDRNFTDTELSIY